MCCEQNQTVSDANTASCGVFRIARISPAAWRSCPWSWSRCRICPAVCSELNSWHSGPPDTVWEPSCPCYSEPLMCFHPHRASSSFRETSPPRETARNHPLWQREREIYMKNVTDMKPERKKENDFNLVNYLAVYLYRQLPSKGFCWAETLQVTDLKCSTWLLIKLNYTNKFKKP